MIQNLELFYLEDDETPSDEDEPTEAEVLRGKLCRSNDGCDWQLDDMDLNQYLDQYHDHKVMLVVASINAASQVENNRSGCLLCGWQHQVVDLQFPFFNNVSEFHVSAGIKNYRHFALKDSR